MAMTNAERCKRWHEKHPDWNKRYYHEVAKPRRIKKALEELRAKGLVPESKNDR